MHRAARPFLCGLGVLVSAAAAAEPIDTGTEARAWSVFVSPYAWAASLTGDAAIAGRRTAVAVPFSDVLSHLDLAVMGNIEVGNGLYGVYLDGQHVETSQRAQALGLRLGIGITTTRLSAGAFFKLHEVALGGQTVFGRPRTLSLEPTAGLRWTRLSADIGVLGLGFGKASDWYDPFAGLRVNADLDARWNLFVQADIGGTGASQYSAHVQAYLGYRTYLLGHETVLRAGYRAIHQVHEAADFTGRGRFRWDVTQHGPALGLTMRF